MHHYVCVCYFKWIKEHTDRTIAFQTLFIVAYLYHHLICSKTVIQNKSSFPSEQKLQKHTDIRRHIPELVYCDFVTNVRFCHTSALGGKVRPVQSANKSISHNAERYKKIIIQEYQTHRGERHSHRRNETRHDVHYGSFFSNLMPRFIICCIYIMAFHTDYLVKSPLEIYDLQIQKHSYRVMLKQPSIKAKVCTN